MSELIGNPEAPRNAEELRSEIDQYDNQMYDLLDRLPESPEREEQIQALQNNIFTARIAILEISQSEALKELRAHMELHKEDIGEMIMMGMDPTEIAFNIWDGFCDSRVEIDQTSIDLIKEIVATLEEEEEEQEEELEGVVEDPKE